MEDASIIVFMTCCVREAADVRLKGQVATLSGIPNSNGDVPRRIICIGGCIGQRDGAALVDELPQVDVVFGTHDMSLLPGLISNVIDKAGPQVEIDSSGPIFDLPIHRENRWHAWLPIMTGCDNFCTYCIVPYVRGRERSRKFQDVMEDVEKLKDDGVVEVTLLGQNVNSYGRDLYGKPRFAELLRAVAQSGIPRVRFVTSHPKDLSDETIAAFAQEPSIMPALHLPVQSGSNRILGAMHRRYTAEQYLNLVDKLRGACAESGKGDIALSTDIIVGFPGETEDDFQATIELVRRVGYTQAFTFIYSRREGTPAADMQDDTPRSVIQGRFDRLVELVQQSAWECNQTDAKTNVPVLFECKSKRDDHILAGKSPKNQTVHVPFDPSAAPAEDYAGRVMDVRITEAKTWYLKGEFV
jgi:tRNA-2-methylthio-N6-dimethylallyladenosine synthase